MKNVLVKMWAKLVTGVRFVIGVSRSTTMSGITSSHIFRQHNNKVRRKFILKHYSQTKALSSGVIVPV